jgi:hypothetical protein
VSFREVRAGQEGDEPGKFLFMRFSSVITQGADAADVYAACQVEHADVRERDNEQRHDPDADPCEYVHGRVTWYFSSLYGSKPRAM